MNLSVQELVKEIVYEQSLVIGTDLALHRATQTGLITGKELTDIKLSNEKTDSKTLLNNLVSSYEELFGRASVEVCLNVFRRYDKSTLVKILPNDLVSSI